MKYQIDDVHCITRSLCWIGMDICDPPIYDGLTNIISLVEVFELQVP
jgi:hypothetical protein